MKLEEFQKNEIIMFSIEFLDFCMWYYECHIYVGPDEAYGSFKWGKLWSR